MSFTGLTRRIAVRYLCYGVEADALTVKLDLPRRRLTGFVAEELTIRQDHIACKYWVSR